jgi:hypothetical protein
MYDYLIISDIWLNKYDLKLLKSHISYDYYDVNSIYKSKIIINVFLQK